MFSVSADLSAQDRAALEASTAYGFNRTPEQAADSLGRMGELLVVKDARERVLGGAGVTAGGVWVNGRSVPAGGVSSVSTDPAARGLGSGKALMRGVLEHAAGRGLPLLALFASTVRFYRWAGFERAVPRPKLTLPTACLSGGSAARFEGADAFALRPLSAEEGDLERVVELQARAAARRAGHWDRGGADSYFWGEVRSADRVSEYVVEHRETGALAGYIILSPDSAKVMCDLAVRDAQATCPGAWAALARFLGSHGALNEKVRLMGDLSHPLMAFADCPPLGPAVDCGSCMMLRVVDVAGALEARGYARGALGLEVGLEVEDELLEANRGRFLLRVGADGRGAVERGAGDGAVRVHVRGLAMLFAGLLSGEQLLETGGFLSAPPAAVEVLDAIFGVRGQTWVSDFF